MPIKEIRDLTSFQEEVQSSEDVVVKFEADWCSPCKAVKPIVEEVARQNPDIKFISVDIEGDGLDSIISEYGVRSVPTFVRVKQGKPVASAVGAISRRDLTFFVRG